MNIVINESQVKKLLIESKTIDIGNKIKITKNFAKRIIGIAKKQLTNDLKFMVGWGAAIGGIMHPLNEFIKGENPSLTQMDTSLIIIGAVSIVIFNNSEVFDEVKKLTDEKGIKGVLKSAVDKTEELKNVFVKFIKSLNLSLHQMTNVVSYAFIIPVLPSIYEICTSSEFSSGKIEPIIKRIIYSISIALSGVLVKELIEKLIKRFTGK